MVIKYMLGAIVALSVLIWLRLVFNNNDDSARFNMVQRERREACKVLNLILVHVGCIQRGTHPAQEDIDRANHVEGY
jgi:hypothetical protein